MYTNLPEEAVSSGHALDRRAHHADPTDVNQNSDFNSLLQSPCSSCEIQSDKSAYWTPQLYFAHANGKFEEVPNYGMTVYYVGTTGVPFTASLPFSG